MYCKAVSGAAQLLQFHIFIMEISIFIIRIMAFIYLALGVGALTNTKWYRELFDEIKKSKQFIFVGGMLALVAGFSIVSAHNIWSSDWTVIVTIIGWISFLKGLSLLALPTFGMGFAEKVLKIKNIIQTVGTFSLIFGIILGYIGYFM